jgi:CRISPR-associated protein Csc1
MIVSRCLLMLHDFTYYATREMGRLYETGKYLHNYGLTFALGLARAAYFNAGQVPTYAAHLAPLNEAGIYVTPARPVAYDFLFHTFKMAAVWYYSITPQTTVNKVLYGRAKELTPASTFEYFVISSKQTKLPRWIRLGKWMSKARVEIVEAVEVKPKSDRSFASACVLNPLDISGRLQTYDLISMPPVSLVVNARIEGPYYELPDGTKIPADMAYTFPGQGNSR